jgi:hypothetical protein
VILAPRHAGRVQPTNYSELFGGASLVISLLNGGPALIRKSGRKPLSLRYERKKRNINAAA